MISWDAEEMPTEIKQPSHFLACLALATVFSSCGKRDSETASSETKSESVGEAEAIGEISVAVSHAEEWARVDDPSADGWESERLAELAKKRLEALGEVLMRAEPVSAADVRPFLSEGFASSQLLPGDLEVVFNDSRAVVQRPNQLPLKQKTCNAAEFADLVNAVGEQFRSGLDAKCAFKVFEIATANEGTFRTRQFVSISGSGSEIHATWDCRWKMATGDELKLASLVVSDFERASMSGKRSDPWFTDCAESVVGGNVCHASQLLRGMNHWLERIPYRAALNRMGTPGLALGDANGDGLDDLYLCQEPGLPNRLFLQQRDGTAKDVSAEWGVDWLQDSRSALFVDLDNDFRQDLVVAVFGGLVVAQNTGNRFEIRAILPTSESTTTLTSADYDSDGRLDLFICAYSPDRTLEAQPQALGPLSGRFVFHDAENGSPNTLFRNLIDADAGWTFRDVTAEVGLDADNTRWSFAASWDDFDNDGDQDLYVANDYGRNCLYRNDRDADDKVRFHNIAAEAGVEDSASGMSAAWGDYDRDGWMDLYVGNMFSAAGSRVTRQAQFKPEIDTGLRRKFQHFARGNTLLRNLGRPDQPGFADTSVGAGVTVGRWAWSSGFVDFNNDGWEDILVANGYQTGDDSAGDL